MFVDSELKKNLEHSFFGLTFEEIKKHQALEKLNLTDEEICKNKKEIKIAINSWDNCHSNKNWCNCLQEHYIAERNIDNQIILNIQKCLRRKNYKHLAPEIINEKIEQEIPDNNYLFTYQEIKKAISNLTKGDNKFSIIENLGDPKYENENWYYVCIKDDNYSIHKKKEIMIHINLFHAILTDTPVYIIHWTDYVTIVREKKNKDHIFEAKLLLLINLGIEEEWFNSYYYINSLHDLITKRHSKNNKTCIITSVSWENIKKCLDTKINRRERDWELGKIESLDELIKPVIF